MLKFHCNFVFMQISTLNIYASVDAMLADPLVQIFNYDLETNHFADSSI